MPTDPVLIIVSRMIESKAIQFANYANKAQIDVDNAIESLGDNIDIEAVIKETRIITSVVDSFQSKVETQIREMIHQLAEMGFNDKVYNDAPDGDLYEWVLGKNHRHCPDCSERAGRIETMKVWNSIGRPDSGSTLCGGFCHCYLRPVK